MGSLIASLLAHAASQPEAPAFIENGRALSYRALAEGAERAATWLQGRGVRAGDTVALAFEQANEDSLRLFYGAGWLGAVLLPLNPEVPVAHWSALLALYRARWVVSSRTDFDAGAAGRIDGRAFAAAGELPGAAARGDADAAPFLYAFSSGTTGTPKAFVFGHAQLVRNVANMAAFTRWSVEDRLVAGQPWPTKVGLRTIYRAHYSGGAFVNAPFPDTQAKLARLARSTGANAFAGAPSSMRKLLAAPLAPGEKLPALRFLYVVGANASPDDLRALRETMTPNVYYSYGATEVGLIAMLRPEDPLEAAGVVGRLAPGLEGRVVGEDGEALAPGAVGRLALRADWLPREYAGNPAASAIHFRDGWFYPGDLAAIGAGGALTLHGRDDDVINFNGVKILPQEIEAVLLRHPDIADAAVLGVPNAQTGQLPVACIVPRGTGIDHEALQKYCLEQCGAQRRPARFLVLTQLPRTAAGKIAREQLLARYEAVLARQGAPRKI